MGDWDSRTLAHDEGIPCYVNVILVNNRYADKGLPKGSVGFLIDIHGIEGHPHIYTIDFEPIVDDDVWIDLTFTRRDIQQIHHDFLVDTENGVEEFTGRITHNEAEMNEKNAIEKRLCEIMTYNDIGLTMRSINGRSMIISIQDEGEEMSHEESLSRLLWRQGE